MSKLFVNDSNTPNHILIEQRKAFINYGKIIYLICQQVNPKKLFGQMNIVK